MAYGFNDDRSKADVYTKAEIDAMNLANDQDLQDEIIARKQADSNEVAARSTADNAEAAARTVADTTINARIDTLVDHGTGGIEVREELNSWPNGLLGGTGHIDDPSDYDCLEVVVCKVPYPSGDPENLKLCRIPVTGGVIDIIYSGASGHLYHAVGEISFSQSDDQWYVTYSGIPNLEYDNSDSSWTFNSNALELPAIYAIYGIKYAQDSSAEVADIRVGYDGNVYGSAGEAVRKSDIGLNSKILQLQQEIIDNEFEVDVTSISNDWKLVGDGYCVSDEDYQILKFSVHEGELFHIVMTESDSVFQWQKQSGVPVSGGTPNLLGVPVNGMFDGYVEAPATATYLMISQLKTCITNSIKYCRINMKQYDEFVYGKNLIGSRTDIFYPVPELHTNDHITLSTADGSTVSEEHRFLFYDKDKNYLGYYAMYSGRSEQTFALAASVDGTRYIRQRHPIKGVDFQLELGYRKTSFSKYIGNSKLFHENLINAVHYDNVVMNRNLIGCDSSVYYPVPELHAGDMICFSTSDGEVNTIQNTINFYDKDKNYLGYYTFDTATRWRTFYLSDSVEGTCYLRPSYSTFAHPMQIELNDFPTEYEPYIGNSAYSFEQIEDLKEIANYENIMRRSFNAAYHTGAENYEAKCKQFASLMYGDTIANIDAPEDCEAFLFFTDPHLYQASEFGPFSMEYLTEIQKYYNSTPTSFCLCGGDWLGSGDLPEMACFKLGYIDGFMHSMFNDCYMVVGNHDTNYQGKLTPESSNYTTRLSDQAIRNLWYRGGKAYYEFDGSNTRFFVFDTGIENQALITFNNYGYEQGQWFASKLMENTAEHIAIALHIVKPTNALTTIQPLTQLVCDIADAFNNRRLATVNGVPYDFSTVTVGKVEFLIGGHAHIDYEMTISNIPCIVTTWVRDDQSYGPTFDLVFVNYDAGEVNLIRVGSGSDRTISLALS